MNAPEQVGVLPYVDAMREDHHTRQQEVERLEAELKAKRSQLTALSRALAAVDPQWAANHKPTSHPRKGRPSMVSSDTRDAIVAFAREHFGNEPFAVPDLMAKGFDRVTQAPLNAGMRKLQDEGRVRLDRIGDHRSNRTKLWVLT